MSRINRETKRFRVEVDGKKVDPIEGIIERGWKIKVPSNEAADLGVDPACCGKERQPPRASFSTYNNREASNIAIATTTIGTRYSVGTTTTAAFCPSSFSFTPPTPSPATVPSSSEGWLTFPQEEHGSQARSILPTYPSRLSPLLPRPVFSDTPIPTGWLAPRCILNQSPGGNAITRHHDASTIFYFKLLYVLVLPPSLLLVAVRLASSAVGSAAPPTPPPAAPKPRPFLVSYWQAKASSHRCYISPLPNHPRPPSNRHLLLRRPRVPDSVFYTPTDPLAPPRNTPLGS